MCACVCAFEEKEKTVCVCGFACTAAIVLEHRLIKGFIREFQRGFPLKLLLRDKLVTLGLIELHCHYRYYSIEGTA